MALRNRLLHFRFCEFFDIKTDSTALMEGVSPRLNQTALSLLSLVDDPALRAEIQRSLTDADAEASFARQEAPEARVLAAVLATFAVNDGGSAPVSEITRHFNEEHNTDYGGSMSPRWIGEVLRKRLRLQTRKSNGAYVVPVTEVPKLDGLAHRYGL
ncbi:MAG: hypothetical protein WDM81_06985 [Rhizomicrobium sp.]